MTYYPRDKIDSQRASMELSAISIDFRCHTAIFVRNDHNSSRMDYKKVKVIGALRDMSLE